jgi:curved DNA-binding protein CbpA
MSTDGFLLLQQPRRPWLDPEALKSRFLELSTPLHPDRFHQAPDCEREEATRRYAALNAAYNQLREPKDRLLHLLELESGGRPKDIQRIPPGTMDLFVEVGQTCRDVDAFLAERAKITSPLARVQYFKTSLEWVERLNRLQQSILKTRDTILEELKSLNGAWERADSLPPEARAGSLPLDRIEQLYRSASYIHRWTEQLQQRSVELTAA